MKENDIDRKMEIERKENMIKENDILEKTLEIAENGYEGAYQFLKDAYEKDPEAYGPQTFYFLACLAGGAGMQEEALGWLKKAIVDHGWWYRPEVLDDEDLEELKNHPAFKTMKSMSDARYTEAVSKTEAVFSWEKKTADHLFLAVHGNTQNGQTAREDWKPIIAGNKQWQIETIQSAEPDGYGTYRWSYDMRSYLPVAGAMKMVQKESYQTVACGGFSAGCDMLLRAIAFTSVRCDLLILQSPWIPVLEEHVEAVVSAIREKNIALRIFCGSEDEDCLPMAKQLYETASREKCNVKLTVQENNRHQFPAEIYNIEEL